METGLDFRLRENRIEAFIRWFVWGLRTTDVDPPIALLNYIFDRQEYNIEQKFWIVFLYGCTYQPVTSYCIWNEIPDYENVNIERLMIWNTKNYNHLRYQTDTRYAKGYLPEMYLSYKEAVGENQLDTFMALCSSQDKKENYKKVFNFAKTKFHKFGRYMSWYYCQALAECVGLPIEPTSLLFEDSGSDSHRNGMCLVVGKDEWTSRYYEDNKKFYRDIKYDNDKVSYLQNKADGIIREIKRRYPDVAHDVNYFRMETALCSFKKLFRKRSGRYLGYYLDRQAEEIRQVEQDPWPGIEFKIFWDYRKERLLSGFNSKNARISKKKMETFLETGTLPELEIYEDLKI